MLIDHTLNAFPIFIWRKHINIECINWFCLIFLCYSYPWTLHSFLILWTKIWYLNNLWFFSKCASIFFSISYRSLNLLLRNLLKGLRNLRFYHNSWKSSLYIWISIRWSESFINSEFWLLLNILWLRFVVKWLSRNLSRRCDRRKTLRLSLILRLTNILLRIGWRQQSGLGILLSSRSWVLVGLITHFLCKIRVLIIYLIIIIILQFVRLINLFRKRYAI